MARGDFHRRKGQKLAQGQVGKLKLSGPVLARQQSELEHGPAAAHAAPCVDFFEALSKSGHWPAACLFE